MIAGKVHHRIVPSRLRTSGRKLQNASLKPRASDGSLMEVSLEKSRQVNKSFIIKGRGSSVVEQPIRNRQVVGSTPTLGSRIFRELRKSRTKLAETRASFRMDEPEGPQTAARGIEFGKTAAFLFDEVVLNPASAFGCFENVFPLCSTFPEQNGVAFRRLR